ncbi:nucleotide sugar dehydrogenase [Bacillus sp. OVS6]|nr:nucleotide sugar dehydrogenase [Bacillus sp. OVS6]
MADKYKGKLAVIGLGFVGLPLSVTLAEKGFQVYGIDVDVRKIASLNQKISYIDDISQERLEHAVENQSFIPTDDYEIMKSVQSIIVCVPTPLTKDKNPDLKYVESAGAEIAKHLQKGQLVILESSTFPGTTKEVLLPLLEKQGLQAGIDFFLANSPERIDPGNKQYAVTQIPKVVGGVTAACQKAAHDLYSQVYDQVVLVSSTEAAELTKLLENTFRFVNISFMNEMAVLCDDLNINIWEVIDAAATKPYGYTPFYPGPGIGGHCIPVDPLYLQWKLLQSKKAVILSPF